MRPVFLFGLTWRGIKRLLKAALQAIVFLVLAYIVVGFATTIIAGLAVFFIVRAVLVALLADD
jgi:hypothetical protein